MEKIKNFVALIPAVLFVYCGGMIYYNSTMDFLYNNAIHNEFTNNHSIGVYFISLTIEIGVIFKNIMDS